MTAQKGKDLLLKMADATNTSFNAVAGMRSRRVAFNAEPVDITDFESAGRWRHLLAGAGVQRASISGSGKTPLRTSVFVQFFSMAKLLVGKLLCRILEPSKESFKSPRWNTAVSMMGKSRLI